MGQYEKDKKELQEKIEQLEHKLKKAKQAGDKNDVDKYSRTVHLRPGAGLVRRQPPGLLAWRRPDV